MNKLAIAFSLCLPLFGFSQNFALGVKNHPFYNIIEWKGQGGLLMSRSEQEFMNQIEISLVAEKEEGMWDQKVNPKTRNPYFMTAEKTNHIYFLDNLDLVNNGRIMFNQMNFGGNIKTKALDVGLRVKRQYGDYGYDYNKFRLLNSGVSEKAMVHLFHYYDKKEKTHHEFGLLMTHHNFQFYLFEVSNYYEKDLAAGKLGHWQYAGFNGEVVYFAQRVSKTDLHGWTIKGYSPKGILVEDHFMNDPEGLEMVTDIGYGTSGKYYQDHSGYKKQSERVETGLMSMIDGKFYLTAVRKGDGGNEVVLMEQDGENWKELNTSPIGDIDYEEDVQFGVFSIQEGVTYRVRQKDGIDKVGIMHREEGKAGRQMDFDERLPYNPSCLLHDQKEEIFITEVPEKVLTCNMKQFQNKGRAISFEHLTE